jgi:hypothetical protein
MEVFRYPQFPPEFATVYIALIKDIQNAAELKKRLVSASVMPGTAGEIEREAVNFAFVNAKLVSFGFLVVISRNNKRYIRLPVCSTYRPQYIMRSLLLPRIPCVPRPCILRCSGR